MSKEVTSQTPKEETPKEEVKPQEEKPKEESKESDEILESSTFKIESEEKLLYDFIISKGKTKIHFKIIQNDSFQKIQYISSFSYEDIIKIAKWFKQYDTLDECYEDMITCLTEKKINLFKKEENKFINFQINHNEKKNSVFQIILKENNDNFQNILKENNDKDIMNQLIILRKEMNEMKEKIKDMEKMNKKVKKILFSNILTEEDEELLKNWIFRENNDENDDENNESSKENNKNKTKIMLKLLFSSRINGDELITFHTLCDNKGPTLTVIKSKDGNRFGGYTSRSWNSNSTGQYLQDQKAILFNLDKKKFAKSNDYKSIYCYSGCGPVFGSGIDLFICKNFLDSDGSYNKNGTGYIFEGEGDYFLNNGKKNFKVEEMEVFNVFLVNDDE